MSRATHLMNSHRPEDLLRSLRGTRAATLRLPPQPRTPNHNCGDQAGALAQHWPQAKVGLLSVLSCDCFHSGANIAHPYSMVRSALRQGAATVAARGLWTRREPCVLFAGGLRAHLSRHVHDGSKGSSTEPGVQSLAAQIKEASSSRSSPSPSQADPAPAEEKTIAIDKAGLYGPAKMKLPKERLSDLGILMYAYLRQVSNGMKARVSSSGLWSTCDAHSLLGSPCLRLSPILRVKMHGSSARCRWLTTWIYV